jgi:hypothetical protein
MIGIPAQIATALYHDDKGQEVRSLPSEATVLPAWLPAATGQLGWNMLILKSTAISASPFCEFDTGNAAFVLAIVC